MSGACGEWFSVKPTGVLEEEMLPGVVATTQKMLNSYKSHSNDTGMAFCFVKFVV